MSDIARAIRLAVTVNVWNQGLITTEEAYKILSGPLTPDDDTTIVDDRDLLYFASLVRCSNIENHLRNYKERQR